MAEKMLTISLLVSGREKTTKKCLDSLKGILERIDSELILVDTGCSESFRKELYAYTENIISFSWCNDFAKARNAGRELAKGEWFLFLDDDEWFDDVTPIVDFFLSGEYKDYEQAVYKARNYSDFSGKNYTEEWVSRMIHLEEDTRFEGRVHESLVPARGRCKKLNAFVHHYGYVFATEEEKEAHYKRNTDILLQLIKEEPNNMRWRLQLLLEYHMMKDGEAIRRTGEEALELIQNIDQPFVNQCRGAFYAFTVLGLQMEKDDEEAQKRCVQYLKDARNSSAARCALYALGAENAEKGGQYERAAEYACAYLDEWNTYRKEEKSEQEQIIEESILLVKNLVTEEQRKAIRTLWALALVRLGRRSEFPEELRTELKEDIAKKMAGNGEFLFLPDDIWEIAAGGLLPLEEMILGLELSQWMAVVIVLERRKSPADWEKVRNHLAQIRTKEDIRYDYLDMHDAKAQLLADASESDYERMCGLLRTFADSGLRFAQRVYTAQAFEGEMAMLQADCRGAVWIDRMLTCGEQEWGKKLDCLKSCAKAWQESGEMVKHFAKLLGEEQEKQQAAASAANEELRAMAKQVQAQVRTLMDAGMYAEAAPIVRQLRGMLPEDEELLHLEKELEKKFS